MGLELKECVLQRVYLFLGGILLRIDLVKLNNSSQSSMQLITWMVGSGSIR